MNRFRKHGFIEYNGRIRVHKSLLNVILLDQHNKQNAISASLVGTGPRQSKKPAEELLPLVSRSDITMV